jgi:1-hydroxycarotenoid 3,4-desaturase
VLERFATPGGKMRIFPSVAGPVDAGPTVLTMKPVFDQLFADVGTRLDQHVVLEQETILARHFWPDGHSLDLMSDHDASVDRVGVAFGARAATEFNTFCQRAARLFNAFEGPMMHAATPTLAGMSAVVLRDPTLIPAMSAHKNMAQMLRRQFTEPKLAQLFARYATYVGGVPGQSPALLSLIWEAERRGVWHVKGGMHQLARAIADLAAQHGATFHYDTHVNRIEIQDGRAFAVETDNGRLLVDAVLFNGDPRALETGQLGGAVQKAVAKTATQPRSLSANVFAFAATPTGGFPLAAHNVFFANDPAREYLPLGKGQPQDDPTLYICAQDRFAGAVPDGPERFEIILNAPPTDQTSQTSQETSLCQTLIFNRLAQFGLRFSPAPDVAQLTTPVQFNAMFPASMGSLYGRSPRGMMAAFQRPTARSKIEGLYLVGGGVHPGAGVPMATLCAAHAAAAMIKDLNLTSTSLPEDTPGGTSTA